MLALRMRRVECAAWLCAAAVLYCAAGRNRLNVGLVRRRSLPALENRWQNNTTWRFYLNQVP